MPPPHVGMKGTREPGERSGRDSNLASAIGEPQHRGFKREGFAPIPNHIVEALQAAPFSATQHRIVASVIRLTIGWHQATVVITLRELALRAGTTAHGHFRASLSDLIAEGVVLEPRAGRGHTASVLGLQHDVRKWGRFAAGVSAAGTRLAGRPRSADHLIAQLSDVCQADSNAQVQALSAPGAGLTECPASGGFVLASSLLPASYSERKDSDRQGKDNSTTPTILETYARQFPDTTATLNSEGRDCLSRLVAFVKPADAGCYLHVCESALHGGEPYRLTPPMLRSAVDDFLTNGEEPHLGRFRGYLRRSGTSERAVPRGPSPFAGVDASDEFERVREFVKACPPRFAGHEQIKTFLDSLSDAGRVALRTVGGVISISLVADKELPYVTRDFLRAYAQAADGRGAGHARAR